jgi:hypothetical protein
LLAILFNLYGNAKGTAGDLRAYHEHASEALRLDRPGERGPPRRRAGAPASPWEWRKLRPPAPTARAGSSPPRAFSCFLESDLFERGQEIPIDDVTIRAVLQMEPAVLPAHPECHACRDKCCYRTSHDVPPILSVHSHKHVS